MGTSLVAQWYKDLPTNAGDSGSIPVLERDPEEGEDNSFQYSCLKNPIERGTWQATVHGVTKVRYNLVTKQQQLITYICTQVLHNK